MHGVLVSVVFVAERACDDVNHFSGEDGYGAYGGDMEPTVGKAVPVYGLWMNFLLL